MFFIIGINATGSNKPGSIIRTPHLLSYKFRSQLLLVLWKSIFLVAYVYFFMSR